MVWEFDCYLLGCRERCKWHVRPTFRISAGRIWFSAVGEFSKSVFLCWRSNSWENWTGGQEGGTWGSTAIHLQEDLGLRPCDRGQHHTCLCPVTALLPGRVWASPQAERPPAPSAIVRAGGACASHGHDRAGWRKPGGFGSLFPPSKLGRPNNLLRVTRSKSPFCGFKMFGFCFQSVRLPITMPN